jgi:hypothetical protein
MALLDDRYGNDRYRKGGYWRIDDRDGSRQRASDTLKEWNGAIVAKEAYEPRHPQDFIRGRLDKQAVPDPRPVEAVANASFVGTPTASINANAPAGAIALVFDSTSGFSAGDQIAIMLDNLDRFLATIKTLGTDGVSLTIATPLPFSVSVGNYVSDYSAMVSNSTNYPSTIGA